MSGELLRFFTYWRQAERRTDHDLVGAAATTADRVRALVERRYLTMSYLLDRWRGRTEVTTWDGQELDEPVTYVGVEAPADLPDRSEVYTLDRLGELIPK